MKQFKQTGIIFFIIISIFCFSSCLNNEDYAPRTQQMELIEINQYLSSLIAAGHNVDTTDLGVYYIIREEGVGSFPKQGDTVTVGYAGYFIDGRLFDSSRLNSADSTITFNFLEKRMIAGFEDGLKLMNNGTLIEMIIPSSLAYGASGTLYIPAYASLIFVAKMEDLKPVVVSE